MLGVQRAEFDAQRSARALGEGEGPHAAVRVVAAHRSTAGSVVVAAADRTDMKSLIPALPIGSQDPEDVRACIF